MFLNATRFDKHLFWEIDKNCNTENFFTGSKISKKYNNLKDPFSEDETHPYYDENRKKIRNNRN